MHHVTALLAAALTFALTACSREEAAAPAPSAPTAPAPEAPAPAPAATSTGGRAASAPASGAPKAVDGQAVYLQVCATCHTPGIAGAPRIGDQTDWAPRIAQGKAVLYQHAIVGYAGRKGVMPPRGGSSRPDEEVQAAVDHLVAQGQ